MSLLIQSQIFGVQDQQTMCMDGMDMGDANMFSK